jgi:Tol biopolymer transport system component
MATGQRPEPGVQRSRLHSDLTPLVDALLDPDPAKRPQSAADIAERLRQLTAGGRGDSQRRRSRTLVGIGVAVIAIVAVVAWWWTQRASQSQVLEVVGVAPIAVAPGAKFDPTLSPDCRSIAFGWTGARGDNPGLYVAPTTGGEPRRLTHSAPPGLGPKAPLDLDPKWSPDGRRIAFLRVPAGGLSFELRVIGANGGAERKVRDVLLPPSFDASLEWMADGRSVLLPMRDPETQFASLFRVEVDDRGVPARRILAASSSLSHPALSPGGRWLAYLENHTLRVHQLGPDGMPTGEPRDVVEGVELRSFHWSSDDRTLLFMNGTTSRVSSWDSETNAVDLVYAAPVRIQAMAATWAESCGGPKAMLTIAGGQVELRSLALLAEGTKAAGPFQLVTQGTVSPAFSPDGRWIAFSRFFEGTWDLWLMDASGQRMHRLTALKAIGLREPSWSPDGRQIAFHARREGRAEVFVLDIDAEAVMARPGDAPPSVEPRRVVEVPFDLVAAQWSRDGKYLYALRNDVGRQFRFPAAGGEIGEIEDLFESDAARVHPTADRIYYAKRGGAPPGIFSRSLVGNIGSNPEQQVHADPVAPSGWTVTERGIYYFARFKLGTPDVMRFFDFTTRRSFDLGPTTRLMFSTLRASPDGSRLIYDTTLESDGSLLALQLGTRPR